jgi:polygalacturonase
MLVKKMILIVVIILHGSLLFSKDYLITDFGAETGKLSTLAIKKAVDECYVAGGGRVVIPPGTFITGPVILKSNVNFFLESGAVLKGSENIEDLIFDNIIIDTRLYNGHWWGHGEPIHISCVSRFPNHEAGKIRNVTVSNIIASGQQGILVFGKEKSRIENLSFNKVVN